MTNCHRLKLEAVDGEKYLTDVASPEILLRLIQSVPSPKAEPINTSRWRSEMKRVMLTCGVVCIAMISSGCSTVSRISGKDGRETLVIRCDAAASLSGCREQAKNECPRGYTTISETTGANRKEIRVICKDQAN